MKDDNKKEPIINIFIKVCSLLATTLGILAILGWIFDITQLAGFDPGVIPMPLSTAVLFVVYGLIIFFHNRLSSSRIMSRVEVVISSIGILVALLFLYFSLSGIRPDVEHLGMKIHGTVNVLVAGHMSPVTAFCFVLVSLSFLMMRTKPEQKKLIKTSLILAVLVFFISIILLLLYLLGTPLLYEGSFIPPALTTSLALLFLGTALLLKSVLKVWSHEEISDVLSTRYTYILALVFIVLIVSIMTVGYSYYKNYEKQYRSETQYQLSSIALLKVNQIVQWRKERLIDAEGFHQNAEFSGLVKRFVNNQNDTDAKKRIKDWIEEVRSTSYYNRICLYDTNGVEVIFTPDEKIPKPFIFSLSSSVELKSGQIAFEDFYRDVNDNNIYLTIFIPILSEQSCKNVIGVLALRIDPEQYLYPLINEWPTLSKTAETLLIRREGNDALFLNELKFQKNTALNLRRPLTEINLPAAQAALGKKEFMEGIDYRGVPVIAYLSPIPNSPWYLVARMDISEIYAPLRERFWVIIILVVGLLIGSGTSLGLIWRQLRSKFYQERYQSTENIRRLNHVFVLLSDINEAIIRIRNPQELFEKACDIAVEIGGFQMAWIGKINSQTMKVDVVVSKGLSEAHLKKIDFNCEGDESLLGIVGRVTKTGVHVISNDIQQDESILPQHKESIIYGSKSFAAFPLKIFGQIWGVFKLYSSEIDFFDTEELKLLDKLAMNISFAIEIAGKEAERKQAEEALKQERNLLGALMDNTPDHIYFKDLENRFIRISKTQADIFGVSDPSQIIGKTDLDFFTDEHARSAYETELEIIKTGRPVVDLEEKETWPDGTVTWVSTTKVPLRDIYGKIIGTFGISRGITERKRAQKELIAAKERAEESDKLKTEFLAQMSHEIRTPINIMLGNVDYLNQSFGENMDSEARDCFDGIDLASKRIIRTVDLILNTAELQTSSYNPQFVKIDLNSKILKKLYQEHQLSAKQKGLEIIYTCKEKDTDIIADEYSITQIFANLIDNAIKYTKKGKVEILLGKNKTGNIMVEVKDTGLGISKKNLPRIFEPFTQEEQGYNRSFEGNGLGLALVKRYCELNNIIIEVESEKNVGSTFRIIFDKKNTGT